jgi:hypothetical protein
MRKIFTKTALTGATAIIIYLMILNFVFHMVAGWQYGLFTDENYYFSMSNHLDIGYVDVTPVTAWLMALSRLLLGDSVPAMRVFPALAGSFTMLFAALTARKMGGGRFSQGLTALVIMLAPSFLAIFSMFIYDAFDQLMSAVVIYMAARILSGEDSPKTWVLFGLLIGVGIMVKITMGFLVLALVFGLLLTRARKYFACKWFWISAAIALTCFIPYIIWQWTHGFPLADYLHFYTRTRTIAPPVWQLFLNVWLSMSPLSILLWLGGLILLFTKRGKTFRAFAWAFLFYFALAGILYVKFYALGGVLLALTAFGAVCLEKNYRRPSPIESEDSALPHKKRGLSRALKASYMALLCLLNIALAPLSMPVLSPEDTAAYDKAIGFSKVVRWETTPSTGLPFILSARLGWEELASAVSEVYHALPESDREECSILCMNYGEAGAINYYSEAYDLPSAISGHLSHYYWGYGDYNGKCLIIFGLRNYSIPILKYTFEEVTAIKGPHTEYGLSYENDMPIYTCKGLKISLEEFWESVRSVQ